MEIKALRLCSPALSLSGAWVLRAYLITAWDGKKKERGGIQEAEVDVAALWPSAQICTGE